MLPQYLRSDLQIQATFYKFHFEGVVLFCLLFFVLLLLFGSGITAILKQKMVSLICTHLINMSPHGLFLVL